MNDIPSADDTPLTEAALATGRYEYVRNVTNLCRRLEKELRNTKKELTLATMNLPLDSRAFQRASKFLNRENAESIHPESKP